MKKLLSLIILMTSAFAGMSQISGGITVFGTVYQGDTIPMEYLDPVLVTTYINPLSAQEKQKYSKLIRNVRKAYPYAKKVESILTSYSRLIANAQNDSQKEKIRKQAMKDVEDKFSSEIKKLSKTQGKILVKLVHRQTGTSSYALVKNFAGGMKTSFISLTTKAMGINLNTTFDPVNNEEDRMIERIVFCIDNGKL
ncbi:MAG: DUF4294 domain-containing protein [Bacteroidales bacterium]|nr:DUF4294 domain-containing protein [Bacteroidales bacterium]